MYTETLRTVIRNFNGEDATDLYEILGDEETMENCEPAYGLKKTKDFLASFCIKRNGAVASVHKESGKVIGYILFNECEADVYEIGWIFNRRFWRCGYAYESCKAVIDFAFEKMNARKIFAETADTVKSVKLMMKLGMQRENVQHSQVQDTNGSMTVLQVFALTYAGWKNRRNG